MLELNKEKSAVPSATVAWADAVLAREIPGFALTKAMYDGMVLSGKPIPKPEPLVKADRRRAELMALPESELRGLYDGIVRQQQEADARRAAAVEAAKFYNAPGARAAYGYWLTMDTWSLDDMVALLLGRDPRVVSWEAISAELEPKGLIFKTKAPPTQFVKAYLDLRKLAQGSDMLTANSRVRPADAAAWFAHRLKLKLPEGLRHLAPPLQLSASEPAAARNVEAAQSQPPKAPASTLVKRAALRRHRDRWPTVDNDLNHADRNGLREAAKASEYGLWREEDALEWARREGKLLPDVNRLHAFPSRRYSMDD